MDDVTDTVFRQVVADCARPDVFFTEFVNVDGLQSPGRANLLKKLQNTAKEQPLIAQIWGLKPESFYKTAQQIIAGEFGKFAGIDLNMGCPIQTVIKNGACSGLINNRELAAEIIKATQEGAAGKLPVSVKTRLGFNEIDLSWHEFLLKHDLSMLTIHGRTRKEMSKVPAHWQTIGEVRKLRDKLAPKTLIVGNGSVLTLADGLELAQKYQLDGIMIGQGILQDPFLFAEESPWENYSREQKLKLYEKHVQLYAKTRQPDKRRIHTLNKFCKIYINGFDGAKELREQLMAAESSTELLSLLDSASLS